MASSDDRVITINRVAVVLLAAAAAACATGHPAEDTGARAKYPRRRPGCDLQMFHDAAPKGIAAWDDLGVAEVGCHVDTPEPQCLRKLKEEACRMGGDILYNVPNKPLRPADQVMIFRAQVAHTLAGKPGNEPEGPSSLPTGPVEPLIPHPLLLADGGAGG